ncbi:MAG: hypothetical protein K2H37_11290 [Lachnospiraceae bacterium]|nr:hypothetical protein [Lachnospiraceae bacterium]
MKIFWTWIHTIMFSLLTTASSFKEITKAGIEIYNDEKLSNVKRKFYLGEQFMMLVIIFAVIFAGLRWFSHIVVINQTAAICSFVVAGILYACIAVRQIIKMIFIPVKRAFSSSDINNFVNTYMGWWLIVLVESSIEIESSIFNKISPTYKEVVMVGMHFAWYYFNILFALGSVYILLVYLCKAVKCVMVKFNFRWERIETIVNHIFDLCQRGEKYGGLKSFRLWKENNKKSVVNKIFMTIPLLLFDIVSLTYRLAKYSVQTMTQNVVKLIYDSIRTLFGSVKILWNRYENNEWIYLLAQVAGLISYGIVFFVIQYNTYEEATKTVYEVVGTIVLIPYFVRKITK